MDQSITYFTQLFLSTFTYFTAFIYTLTLTIPHQNPFKTSFGFELIDPIIPKWLKWNLAWVHS